MNTLQVFILSLIFLCFFGVIGIVYFKLTVYMDRHFDFLFKENKRNKKEMIGIKREITRLRNRFNNRKESDD